MHCIRALKYVLCVETRVSDVLAPVDRFMDDNGTVSAIPGSLIHHVHTLVHE